MERIALQDAERERERVLKEAEEKLKELELSNQLNETQVKKPVEDVINSSKPIQLTNLPSASLADYNAKNEYRVQSDYNVNNETVTLTSNYGYGHNYAASASNPPVYSSYNTSVIREPNALQQTYLSTTTQSTSSQSCLPQSNQQNNVQSNIQTSTIPNLSSNILNNLHTSLPQTTLSQNSSLPSSTNYLPPIQTSVTNLSIGNSNLPLNSITTAQPLNGQLAKTHHHSDNKQPLSNSHLQNNPNSTNRLGQANYNVTQPQLYTQSHHPIQTNLSNYSVYTPTTTGISSMNNTASNLRGGGVYNLPHAYPPTMTHLNHTPNHQSTVSSINQLPKEQHQIKSNSPTINYNTATNYVPSSSYPNGILMPQQSPLLNNANKQVNDKKTETNNKPDKEIDKTASTANSSTNNISTETNPFLRTNGKKIDVADFENSSSPFDDALLRSIDEKEELSNIFQQFYHNGNGAK